MTATDFGPAGPDSTVDLQQNDMLWLDAYRTARAQETYWADLAKTARQHLEQALGERETGLVDGKPVIRWTTVYSNRLDQKKLKDADPALYLACQVQGAARRFTVVGPA